MALISTQANTKVTTALSRFNLYSYTINNKQLQSQASTISKRLYFVL